MDMEFGPDGALYVLDYGTGWFGGDANSALYRIEYISGGNRAPIARSPRDPDLRPAPLTVQFSSAGSTDPDGDALTYAWDFNSNGTTDSTAANPSFTYTTNGDVHRDADGPGHRRPDRRRPASSITVGNTRPR